MHLVAPLSNKYSAVHLTLLSNTGCIGFSTVAISIYVAYLEYESSSWQVSRTSYQEKTVRVDLLTTTSCVLRRRLCEQEWSPAPMFWISLAFATVYTAVAFSIETWWVVHPPLPVLVSIRARACRAITDH